MGNSPPEEVKKVAGKEIQNNRSRIINEEIETLLAISVVSRRLARNLRLLQLHENEGNGG